MNPSHASTEGNADASTENAGHTFLQVASRLHCRVDEVLAPLDLTYPQYRAIERVRVSGGLLLQESPDVPGGNVVDGALHALEPKRLVRIRPDARGDGVRVELTPAGSARALIASRELDAVMGDLAASFNTRESVRLRELLTKVHEVDGPSISRSHAPR